MLRRLFPVCAALALFACGGGPQLNVVSQANPSPLKGETKYSLAAFDFSAFEVGKYKSEADFLETKKKEEDKAAWEEDKGTLERSFARTLTEEALGSGITVAAGDAGTVIKTKVTYIDPGSPMRPTEVNLVITVLGADGKKIDELHETEALGATLGTTTGSRLKYLGQDMGKGLAQYLIERGGRK